MPIGLASSWLVSGVIAVVLISPVQVMPSDMCGVTKLHLNTLRLICRGGCDQGTARAGGENFRSTPIGAAPTGSFLNLGRTRAVEVSGTRWPQAPNWRVARFGSRLES